MKRVFILLIVCILVVVNVCMAEQFDLSSMTDDELTSLREAIELELSVRNQSLKAYGEWMDYGLGQKAPNPSIVFEREWERDTNLNGNDDTRFYDNIKDVTREEFESYCNAARSYGFNKDLRITASLFDSYNEAGEQMRITYLGTTFSIRIYAAE